MENGLMFKKLEKRNTFGNLRVYFLILNVVIAIVSFSYVISAQTDSASQIGTNVASNLVTRLVDYGISLLPNPGGIGKAPGGQVKSVGNEAGEESAPGGQVKSESSGEDSGEKQTAGGQITPTKLAGGALSGIGKFFKSQAFLHIGGFTAVGAAIGGILGGSKGATSGAIAGLAGGVTFHILSILYPSLGGIAFLGGIGISSVVFLTLYKKESIEIVDFTCAAYQPPIGGNDCSLCNDFEVCSKYSCKSLGQACDIVNAGTEEEKCVWINPNDVNSPKIDFREVSEGHQFKPDLAVRPPAIGVEISLNNGNCINAFTPLEFTFITNEPAQCKIDINLETGFDEMSFFVGGSSNFLSNHTEKLSLPGPDAINSASPELQNDGLYSFFVRCQDANGNFNLDPFSIKLCVEKGPDTTPPRIETVNIPSGNPIKFNQTSFDLEVYVNEPSECKWSRTDTTYDNMENEMDCDKELYQINSQNLFTCRVDLTGIENRKDNDYYFRCKDQPFKPEADRNVNVQSYLYTLVGTQPLNIISIEPNDETIFGASNVIPVFLEVITDNGYENGKAVCSYNTIGIDEDYIQFLDTNSNKHLQRQDITSGNYDYYIQCIDLGGNVASDLVSFRVESDRSSPVVVRVYKEAGQLKIITNEAAECSFSTNDCNFEIESGIQMNTGVELTSHVTDLRNNIHYIRCKDRYDNQPIPSQCSIVVKPSDF